MRNNVATLMRVIKRGFHFWTGLAALVLLAGSASSIFVAQTLANNANETSKMQLRHLGNEFASTFELVIAREQDYLTAAAAFIANNPSATQAQFAHWTTAMRIINRFPEIKASGMAVLVPAAQLSAFIANDTANPSTYWTPSGSFQYLPKGRTFYCFSVLAVARTAADAPPPGADLCAGKYAYSDLWARDTGHTTYLPFQSGKSMFLRAVDPVYRGGIVPSTIAARRQAFIGWVGMAIDPKAIVAPVLQDHPNDAIILRYQTSESSVLLAGGSPKDDHASVKNKFGNGWSVQTFGQVSSTNVLSDADALALLLGGVALSIFLAGVIDLLGSGRARAFDLVRRRTEELQHQALHDALTGLPNRALILDRLGQMLARAKRHGHLAAVLFVDLDNFKGVNDTLGHRAGDHLLRAVGARLENAIRDADTVGRIGGDEFVVLVEGDPLAEGLDGFDGIAQRILEVLGEPFEISDSESALSVSASIGVAAGDREAPEDLLRDADIALYQAKARGKRRAVVFAKEMHTAVATQHNLGVDLETALLKDQFFLAYQPCFDLRNDTILGVEALLRWNHPRDGLVMPDEFIPELEHGGFIIPVGNWVLNQACRQGAIWCAIGFPIDVSVNLSGKQLERHQIVQEVSDALAQSGFDPGYLILELTESVLMSDKEMIISRLRDLKRLGVRLAVDDFGTGYSSLGYLQQFPVDILKIDKSFVAEIGASTQSGALVHTLAQLGKVLGLAIVAEGIETNAQRIRLRNEKIDGGQGYLFSKPVTAEEITGLLQNQVRSATSDDPEAEPATRGERKAIFKDQVTFPG